MTRRNRIFFVTILSAGIAAIGVATTTIAGGPAWMPGPSTSPRSDAALRNADCERCHVEIAAAWRASRHRSAFTGEVFQRAFAYEPLPMCQACHAPDAGVGVPVAAQLASLGVSCVSCHERPDRAGVLAAPKSESRLAGESPAQRAPHEIVREPAFATASACNRCHEFSFPDGHGLMQSTASEHAASAYKSVPCASCHMPHGTDGRRSHAFASSRDPAMIRAAVTVRAMRVGDSQVQIRVSPNSVGHAFPTGDMFRRIEIVADVVGPEHQALATDQAFLARQFETGRDGVKREVADTRLTGARSIVLDLGPTAEGRTIAWRAAYQRLEAPNTVGRTDAELESEIVLAQGALVP